MKEYYPWILCAVLLFITIFLLIREVSFKIHIKRMISELKTHLEEETNTLLSVSTKDRRIKELANELNHQLILLREERQEFLSGNRELKDMLTGIVHDLRTPITAISGYLELIDDQEISGKNSKYLEVIKDRTELLKTLTEELFAYSTILSKKEELTTEEIDVKVVLEQSLASFYTEFHRAQIEPTVILPEESVFLDLNKTALQRIFYNILNNILKYSDGDLEIKLSPLGELTFSNISKDLDEVEVGKLFNRFFTVNNAKSSTGFGLYISKVLTEQMGGMIEARYQEDRLEILIKFNQIDN